MTDKVFEWAELGKVGAPYGVKGWLKIHSWTEQPETLFEFKPWFLRNKGKETEVELIQSQSHGKGFIAKFKGCDDRSHAEVFVGAMICVPKASLPKLDEGEYYWSDLLGLKVVNLSGDELGKIDRLIETGANDVLIVVGEKEHWLPWLMPEVIHSVDLTARIITVDWDEDF